jgi:hypothetical protein
MKTQIVILLLISFLISFINAESCICETVTTQINSSSSMKNKYCATVNANAHCVSGRYSGTVETGCYSTKSAAEDKLTQVGSAFKCYYQDGTVYSRDPTVNKTILSAAVIVLIVIFCICCGIGICGALALSVGLLVLILGKNKRFMNYIGNYFYRVSVI